MLTFRFSKADGHMVERETLTSGMVGKEVRLEFSADWEGLRKTVVFCADGVSRDVVDAGEVVAIPHEVLAEPRKHLYVGVYGVGDNGRIIPTVRAKGPFIHPGADPAGDEGTDPSLPVWAQLQEQIDDLKGGLQGDAAALLVDILRSGVFRGDRSDDIDALAAVFGIDGGADE